MHGTAICNQQERRARKKLSALVQAELIDTVVDCYVQFPTRNVFSIGLCNRPSPDEHTFPQTESGELLQNICPFSIGTNRVYTSKDNDQRVLLVKTIH